MKPIHPRHRASTARIPAISVFAGAALAACTGSPNTTADAADDDAAADACVEHAGGTVLALNRDGIATLVDAAGRITALFAEPLESFYAIELSPDGTTAAFCASDDGVTIDLYGGRVGAIRKLVEADMCKDARPSPDGAAIAFVEYGGSFSPPQRLRLIDADGALLPGDASFGGSKLWTPTFWGPDQFALIYTTSGAYGPLWLADPVSDNGAEVIAGDLFASFHEPGAAGLVLSDFGRLVGLTLNGEVTEILSLRDDFPDAPIRAAENPSVDAAGRHVVFIGRVQSGGLGTEVFTYDRVDRVLGRLTEDEVSDLYPQVDSLGEYVYWKRATDDLVRRRLDMSGPIEVVVAGGVHGRFDLATAATGCAPVSAVGVH